MKQGGSSTDVSNSSASRSMFTGDSVRSVAPPRLPATVGRLLVNGRALRQKNSASDLRERPRRRRRAAVGEGSRPIRADTNEKDSAMSGYQVRNRPQSGGPNDSMNERERMKEERDERRETVIGADCERVA